MLNGLASIMFSIAVSRKCKLSGICLGEDELKFYRSFVSYALSIFPVSLVGARDLFSMQSSSELTVPISFLV